MKRISAIVAILVIALLASISYAANVVIDGTMESNPTANWPLTNVTGTATASKDTARKGSLTASLKGLSQAGRNKAYEWYHSQSVGTIQAGSTGTLSFWYGTEALLANPGTPTTLSVDASLDNGATWPLTLWTQSVSPSAFASATSGTIDISSLLTTTGSYRIRLHVQATTGNNGSAQIAVWWDDVVVDVTAPASISTTIGDGTDPSSASLCPTSGATFADAFTLQSSRDSVVTAVNVSLGSGAATALALVEITNDAGTVVYGSVANPATDTLNVPLSTNVTSTTTATQYRVRVTPKGHAAPSGAYTVTARVNAITSDAATVTNNDAGDVSFAIDNLAPANGGWGTNGAGDASVTLNWSNPGADFSQAVILRSTTTPIAAAPAEGTTTYAAGDTIGTATVVYAGNGTTANDTTVTNGTTYYYKLFARDACGNYSSGVESAALRPDATPQTTTVGNGSDPAASTLCPGGGTAMVDAFTLQTTAASDAVSEVVVTLTGDATQLASIAITDDAGAVLFGSVANPTGNVIAIPTSSLTATATLTQYKVRVASRTHAATTTGSWPLAATVTSITSANAKTYGDISSAAVTIDNEAPSAATWGSSSAGNNTVTLDWSRPADALDVLILRSTSSPITASPADGNGYAPDTAIGTAVVRYSGSAVSFADTSVTNGTTYYYRIFARDACGNYSAGAESAGLTPTNLVPALSSGTGSATVDSCNQATIRAPFSGDAPSNSTTTFESAAAIGGPWTNACAGVTGASPRTCVMSGLTPGSTHYVRVTFTDADGVSGQNPQIVGPFTTPAVCTQSNTTAGSATAIVSACRQLTLTAPFSGDGDADGALKVEFNTANSWPGTVACAASSGAAPRQCLVTSLNPSTQYWLRATYSDPDGVSGTATQVVGPLTTPACGADSAAPMVLFLSPARSAVVGGTERVKVQVWENVALAATNPVRFAIDAGALGTAVTTNGNYSCGDGCIVYEFDVATASLANGAHSITVQATDAAANVTRATIPITVSNNAGGKPRGGGTLLRRTHSAQLCVDCHALASHTSQAAGSTKYGSWANDCLSCHTPHLTTNVGLIRTSIETPSSGPMTVDLRTLDRSGGTNPQNSLLGVYDASGAPFNDGVCEVCHTKTTHYRNDASGGDHTHYQGQRCTGCHTHANGFKGSGCNGCHNAPPAAGGHRTKHDEVWDSTSGLTASSYDDAASHATATQYGFACASCHAGTHANDGAPHDGSIANPWQVEVTFQGLNAGASYSGVYDQASEAGPGGSYFSWSNGTCTNGYCHSNAAPFGGINQPVSVTWSGAATTCASCHRTGGFGDGANDNTFLSKSHAKHIRSTAAESASYAYKCGDCHANVIVANGNDPWNLVTADLADKRLHVDGNKQDVAFGSVGSANQAAGSYDGAARTCGSTYCHSQGTSTTAFVAPNSDIAWGQTATCVTCHNGNAAQAANKMATGKHAAHIDNATTYGQNIGCAACHAGTLTGDTTINAAGGHALHVNGVRDVSGTSAGAWTAPTCASSRCHSSGVRVGTVEYYSVNWTTGAAITDCKACHGRHTDNAFASIAGEPNYANVPASNKYNSHRAHVAAATDCRTCHNSTIATSNRIDGASPAKHMDFDGLPDITFAAPYAAGTYNSGSRTCTVGCHGSGTPTWGGGAILCLGCHSGTEGDALGNGTPNGVAAQWSTKGHGAAAGGSMTSALNGCDYCHDLSAGHAPTSATNPYRLRFSATDNSLCLKCHATGDAGIGVNSAGTNLTLEDSAKDVDDAHFGSKHQTSGGISEGGRLCWDCHDPHGPVTNILMIRENVSLASTAYGVPTVTKPVTFTARATAADFIRTTGATRTGICQACHDPGKGTDATLGSTKYWRWDGTDAGGGASTHQSGTVCTQCHAHNKKFAGAGGDCLGCHELQSQGGRRAVGNDFTKQSHHVGSGGTMGGTLTNFDCVVCHAEGKITAGATDTTGQPHMDGVINLRNVDSATAYFNYDKDAVTTSAGSTLAQWSSANAVWRTQTSTALDPFCLTCHDANGASQIAVLGESGATSGNPFKDTTVTNNYDQQNRGSVTDIKSKVSGAPPAQGTFSRHAIRGQSTSVYTKYQSIGAGYTSVYEFGGFTNMGTSENGALWNDTSVMGCADCHTTDGANGTDGNAHGSASEYLLKDASGGATEGTLLGKSYNCYRCHAVGKYDTGMSHAPNGGDYQDSTALVSGARTTSSKGTIFGIACMNCHGGANGFGWIHGTNQVLGVGANGGAGTRNAYRFMNGGSLRFYQPSNATWSAGAGSCYTLSSGDAWGGCTQHSKSAQNGLTSPTRPLNY